MPQTDLIAVPGLRAQPAAVRLRLVAICTAHGWSADYLAALIAHESGWLPWAANPGSSAVGLLQFTARTAQALGTTTQAIGRMPALDQLGLVEAFFVRANGGRPIDGPDLMVFAVGVGALLLSKQWTYGQALPADGVLYEEGSEAVKLNGPLVGTFGTITVASVRDYFQSYVDRFTDSIRLPLDGPGVPTVAPALPASKEGADLSGWFGLGAIVATGWVVTWLARHQKI